MAVSSGFSSARAPVTVGPRSRHALAPLFALAVLACGAHEEGASTDARSAGVAVDAFSWTPQPAPIVPPAGRLVYDAQRDRLVAFAANGEVWERDRAGAWSRVATGMATYSVMGWDTPRQRIVALAPGDGNATWPVARWSGTAWTQVGAVNRPHSENCYNYETFGFDSNRGVFVIFGPYGQSSGGCAAQETNELWETDGTTMSLRSTGAGPERRRRPELAFDAGRGRMVLTGGVSYANTNFYLRDTWEWDGTSWYPSPATTTWNVDNVYAPMPGVYAGGALGVLASTSGVSYTYQGTAWTAFPHVGCPLGAFDPVRTRLQGLDCGPGEGRHQELTASGWQPLDTHPLPRQEPSVTFDTARSRLVLTGGGAWTTTWERAGTSWSRANGLPTPALRGAPLTFDSVRSESVLFGGCTAPCSGSANLVADTWLWNGSSWRAGAAGPPGARFSWMAFDPGEGAVLYRVCPSTETPCASTWVWNGSAWRAAATGALSPTPVGLAFDAGRSRVVAVASGALWSWSGTAWDGPTATSGFTWAFSPADFDPAPAPVAVSALPPRGTIVGVETATGRTLELSGTQWTEHQPTSSPGARPGSVLAWDAAGSAALLVGGPDSTVWALTSSVVACAADADCASGHCVDGVCCDGPCAGACQRCDGAYPGVCEAVRSAEDPDTCGSVSGSSCDASGVCRRALGVACNSGAQCHSGQCVDGVCCDGACTSPCQACTAALKGRGSDGACGFVVDRSDPDDDCADVDPSDCLADGLCDGAGACRRFVAADADKACNQTTQCSAGEEFGDFCDGQGGCTTRPNDCAPYTCADAVRCGTTCVGAADCASSAFCDTQAGACVPLKAQGAACAAWFECQSSNCVDGVCCDGQCTGQCEACNLPGFAGRCGPVTGAPVGTRAACAGAGACQGSCAGNRQACAMPSAGTECTPAACAGDALVAAATCDGAGVCAAAVSTSCVPYACDAGATRCRTTCTTSADCAGGHTCDVGGACVVAGPTCRDRFTAQAPDGTETFCNGHECINGSCLDACATSAACAPGYTCVGASCRLEADAAATGGSGGTTAPDGGSSGGAAGTGGSAGAGATSGAGGAAGSGGTAGSATAGGSGGTAPSAAPEESGGCGCRVDRTPASGAGALALLLAVGLRRRPQAWQRRHG